MPVIFNRVGGIMAAVGILLFVITMSLPGVPAPVAMLVPGVMWLVWDVAYRWARGGKRFLAPSGGGHLYYVPVWALGVLILVLSADTFRRRSQMAREDEAVERRLQELKAQRPADAAAGEP
jgi:hypothetical protein